MLDYIIVGLGLAGVAFCEKLQANGKRFIVISDASQSSSIVAAGLYNPVILKRFTLAWEADKQLQLLQPFYSEVERKLEVQLDHKIKVLRRFASIEEQNNWFQAADQSKLKRHLSSEILENQYSHIDAPFGFGEVLGTGRIAVPKMIDKYAAYLHNQQKILNETFVPASLQIKKDKLEYRSLQARNIVFAEGYGLKSNPYFNYLPLNGTKGEVLQIKAAALEIDAVIKSGVFIVPLEDNLFGVGATYKWKDKTNTPTQDAKTELMAKLEAFMKTDYEVVAHKAGIRPTVTDRRPLVGRHPIHNNVYVLNGMGSRGVMIAPYASQQLFDFIESGMAIQPEMDVERFSDKYPIAD